jgi:hypothetical protein
MYREEKLEEHQEEGMDKEYLKARKDEEYRKERSEGGR